MKIAIPTVNQKLCMHFGHCAEFVLMITDDETNAVVEQTTAVPPPHEPGVLPRWLGEQQVNVIIAGGMGQRAQELFAAQNIKVVVGAGSEDPEKLVAAYLEGTLQSGANACDH